MLEDLEPHLATRCFGRAAEYHSVIDSTNRRAGEWAEAGAPTGAIVVTEHQTAGRGRLGRMWTDEPGLNLLFSIILRPRLAPDRLGLVALAAGLGVSDAVSCFTEPITPKVKWPNDVLLERQKVAGILAETRLRGGEAVVILGVGINVNQVDFPHEIEARATSLRLVTSRSIPRAHLLATILKKLEKWNERAECDGEGVIRTFSGRMAGQGEEVSARSGSGEITTGVITGVASDGALILETKSGPRTFHAAEITLRSSDATLPEPT